LVFVAANLSYFFVGVTAHADTSESLRQIKALQREGGGNEAAVTAVRELSKASADAIPEILAGMDGADIVVINWLRGAVEAIAHRELSAGRKLPVEKLTAFLKDTKHEPRARRLAFECIVKCDAKAADELLAAFLNDPSAEMRRDAVATIVRSLRHIGGSADA